MPYVKLLHTGRAGDATLDGKRNYTTVYRVITDSPSVGQGEVLFFTPGIPQHLSRYEDATGTTWDDYARLVKKRATQDSQSRRVWTVTCEYSTDLLQLEYTDNLAAKPPEYQWSTSVVEREAKPDDEANGNDALPILNSAKDLIVPPPLIDERVLQLDYEANVVDSAYSPIEAYKYLGAINSDTLFLGSHTFEPYTARCVEWSARRKYTQLFAYWETHITLQFRYGGWKLKIRDQGMRERVDGKLVHIVIEGRTTSGSKSPDVPVNTPVDLNGSGRILPNGEDPVYLDRVPFRKLPFSVMNIQL